MVCSPAATDWNKAKEREFRQSIRTGVMSTDPQSPRYLPVAKRQWVMIMRVLAIWEDFNDLALPHTTFIADPDNFTMWGPAVRRWGDRLHCGAERGMVTNEEESRFFSSTVGLVSTLLHHTSRSSMFLSSTTPMHSS